MTQNRTIAALLMAILCMAKRPRHGECDLQFLLSATVDSNGKVVSILDYAKK
jgi:hypothetical protein